MNVNHQATETQERTDIDTARYYLKRGEDVKGIEELCDTTLIHVTIGDAADDLFRVLMRDKVEPCWEFIEKHALEVKNWDV